MKETDGGRWSTVCEGWACSVLSLRGVHFEYDTKGKCWDVCTSEGWKTAHNGQELSVIATTELRRVNKVKDMTDNGGCDTYSY
jgi:hypothetical protein